MMVEMTPDLAEICGIHAGDGYLRFREAEMYKDGYLRRDKIELEIGGDKEEKEYYDNHVIPLINNYFGLKIKGRFYVKGTYGFVTTNSNFKIFNEFGFPYGKKSLIVQVPKLILDGKNKELSCRFLRGLFDTDGGIYFTSRRTLKNYLKFKRRLNYYPLIRFTTVSRALSEQIVFLLRKLGFDKVNVHSFQPKDRKDNYKFVVYMSGREALERFFNEIGSKNPVKLTRYLVWKKFGFCPPHTTLQQREDILKDKFDIYSVIKGSSFNG
ncbi:MAG: hypothetical protein KKB31_02770 [Nanoarchaeota archaeon]|nr:hypothetical protein [Nanoarchaeota archaeon]